MAFVRMFATFVAVFLVKFLRRRPLLIASALLCSLCTGVLGGYFYLREELGDTGNSTAFSATVTVRVGGVSVDWLPLLCLLLFMTAYASGIGIIPWSVPNFYSNPSPPLLNHSFLSRLFIAEILPADVRGVGCAVAIGFCQLCLFVAVKTFLDLLLLLDTFGTFWLYSAISALGALFVALFVPETANLHTAEIEALFEPELTLKEDESQT
jgi:hypothetical protein